ncbi:hypothetical protein CLHUN_34140 [Ruminiclostridium hungatei]|uniref:Uncharacterized protein n=1 Tax=Ruminiclostridium hungatei TaxID=48256 RepID=A0A1V4SFS2_RUMHU|nr:hypothetical protein CLHUN_34140 [Ruminiclostridium hungatei]
MRMQGAGWPTWKNELALTGAVAVEGAGFEQINVLTWRMNHMQKRWVKWIAIILAVVFILTSVVSVGLSIFGGM